MDSRRSLGVMAAIRPRAESDRATTPARVASGAAAAGD
jgi:hypothetical protein